MINMNGTLFTAMCKFRNTFKESVPLKELSEDMTNEDIINIINESLSTGTNLFLKTPEYQNSAVRIDDAI